MTEAHESPVDTWNKEKSEREKVPKFGGSRVMKSSGVGGNEGGVSPLGCIPATEEPPVEDPGSLAWIWVGSVE